MSTRSLTKVLDSHTGKPIATLYRHCDGYPDGHGRDLATFLVGKTVVNGNGPANTFNGPADLFVRLIVALKTENGTNTGQEPGGFYLYPADTVDVGEEYIYTVKDQKGTLCITVQRVSVTGRKRTALYTGSPEGFLDWLEKNKSA